MSVGRSLSQFWKIAARLLVVCLTSIAMIACGQSVPNIDEEKLLSAADFYNPITLSFSPHNIEHQGQLQDNSSSWLFSHLVANKAISVGPEKSGPPYWSYQLGAPTKRGRASIEFTVGTRQVTDRSAGETWSEAAAQFYATTLTYEIVPGTTDFPVPPSLRGPYRMRLVLAKHPAIGEWRLDQRTEFLQNERALIEQALAADGRDRLQNLRNEIGSYRTQAFDQIEQELATSGRLARSTESENVLVSTNNGLAYYTGIISGAGLTPLSLLKACSKVDEKRYKNWRVASHSEFRAILTEPTKSHRARFVDTPDNRLWRAFSQLGARVEHIMYYSSTIVLAQDRSATLTTIDPSATYCLVQFGSGGGGVVVENCGYYLGSGLSSKPIEERFRPNTARFLCVSDLTETSPADKERELARKQPTTEPVVEQATAHSKAPKTAKFDLSKIDEAIARAGGTEAAEPGKLADSGTLNGSWSGSVAQSNGQQYGVVIEFLRSGNASIRYPELSCGGRLIAEGREGTAYRYTERIVETYRCTDNGTVILTPTQRGLRFNWKKPGIQSTADAMLAPMQ